MSTVGTCFTGDHRTGEDFVNSVQAVMEQRGGDEQEKDLWELAGTRASEVFCRYKNLLLTYQSADWIKEIALADFNEEVLQQGLPVSPELRESIEQVFHDVFISNKWINTLNESNVDAFFTLYQAYLATHDNPKDPIRGNWILDPNHVYDSNRLYCHEFDYRNLEVQFSLATIQEIYNTHDVLQLRPIDTSAKSLYIGCGNGRLSCGGGMSLASNFNHSQAGDYYREYSLRHLHQGIPTIDCGLPANPSIVAFFGDQPVSPVFAGQKFDKIVFEGYFNPNAQQYRKTDLIALLSDEGKLYIDESGGSAPSQELSRQQLELINSENDTVFPRLEALIAE